MDIELLYDALAKIFERRYAVKITYNIVDKEDVKK